MRRPPADGTSMVWWVEGAPGVGESGGWGLAQPGERLERARAGAEKRRRVRVRRTGLSGVIVVGGRVRCWPWWEKEELFWWTARLHTADGNEVASRL